VTASFSDSARAVAFQGIIPVPIANYINNFIPAIAGWQFGVSPWPLAYWWAKNAVNEQAVALVGSVFGPTAHKQTDFAIGNFASGFSGLGAERGNCIYDRGAIKGFFKNDSLPVATANTFNFGLNLGTNLSLPSFSGTNYPAITGARIPGNSFNSGSQLGALGYVYSMNDVNTLLDDYLLTYTGGSAVANGNPAGFKFPLRGLFPTDLNMLAVDPAGRNWATVGGSGSNGRLLALCDFTAPGVLSFFIPTWDNATLNGYLQGDFSSQATRPTPFGWLTAMTNNSTSARPVTIGGKLYNSYMILTSFDCLKYWLLNIIPQDAISQTWQGTVGTVGACIMPSGQMLIHSTNQDAIINTSGLSQNFALQLPVYPPMNIPSPPPDEVVPILPYEANTKSGET
jgi:hypothetical protein